MPFNYSITQCNLISSPRNSKPAILLKLSLIILLENMILFVRLYLYSFIYFLSKVISLKCMSHKTNLQVRLIILLIFSLPFGIFHLYLSVHPPLISDNFFQKSVQIVSIYLRLFRLKLYYGIFLTKAL